jgi:hypothetical protein
MVSSFKVIFTEIVYTLLFLHASAFYYPATSSILGSDTFLISLCLSLSIYRLYKSDCRISRRNVKAIKIRAARWLPWSSQ